MSERLPIEHCHVISVKEIYGGHHAELYEHLNDVWKRDMTY